MKGKKQKITVKEWEKRGLKAEKEGFEVTVIGRPPLRCSACGLGLAGHVPADCIKILRQERTALLETLEQTGSLLGKAARTLRTVVKWVKTHKAHESLKPEVKG